MKRTEKQRPSLPVSAILVVMPLLLFAACSPSRPVIARPEGSADADRVTASVTSAGARLPLGNGMTLVVPAGAVTNPVRVTLTRVSGDTTFSASHQTVLGLESDGALRSAFLRVPIDSTRRPARVAMAYRAAGNRGAVPLTDFTEAAPDTLSFDLTSVQTPTKGGPAIAEVGRGSYVVEHGTGYTTTRVKSLVPIPYYQQDGDNCWAAAMLMFLRSHTTVLSRDEIYEILSLFHIGKNDGIAWTGVSALARQSGFLTGLVPEQHTWISYDNFLDYVMSSLDQGKPVLTCVVSHQIVICGYEIEGTGPTATTYLIFHDPQLHEARRMYTRMTAAEVKRQWWNQGLFSFNVWNFVTMTMTTARSQAPRLQTIQLLESLEGGTDVLALHDKGIAFGAGEKVVNTIIWDHLTPSGLRLSEGSEVPPDATKIAHRRVPVWNTDPSAEANLRVRTTLHRVQNGVYREPPLLADEQAKAVPAMSGAVYGALLDLEPVLGQLGEEDTLFALVTTLHDQGNLVMDDFDVQFVFRPLRIHSLQPGDGAAGDQVVIEGIGFGREPSQVTFNGITAEVRSWSNTRIVAVVPSGAASGEVVVTVGRFHSNGMAFSASGSMLERLHETRYPSVNVMGVFRHQTWTGYALFSPSYIWDSELTWNGTGFAQRYTRPTAEMRETVEITGSVDAEGGRVEQLSAYLRQEMLREGRVWQQVVSEIRIADLPLELAYDDEDDFMAVYDLEGGEIPSKLSRIRYTRTDFDEQGGVAAVDTLVSADWTDPNHEGLVQIWFHEHQP